MEHSTSVDLILQLLNSIDGDNGTQSFSIEGQSYSLEFYRRKMQMETSKPTQEDCDSLPTCEMTLSHPFNLEIDSILKHRHMINKKMRAIRGKLNKLSESSGTTTKE